ncbi:DUF2846 domain-containing protein [Uliginosibacterium paludis]|uniref:DUF2846 domain-containing protein n=1 Tax=Uliginosibacterium paludis TaxID=1615952 RepID=A0ABV2CVR1_9RHOO
MRKTGLGLLLGMIVMLAACSMAPQLPPPVRGTMSADEMTKRFVRKPGVARVYVYRNTRHGKDFPVMLKVDDEEVGTLAGYTYMALELPPGVHRLRASNVEEGAIELMLEGGSTSFLQLNIGLSMAIGKPELLPIHQLEGENSIRTECSLVLPRKYGLNF